MKQCNKCGTIKEDTAFDPHRRTCRQCRVVKQRTYYAPKKEITRQRRLSAYQDGLKRCKACGELKPLKGYLPNSAHWDKLSHVCRKCAYKNQYDQYVANPEKQNMLSRRWYENNKERKLEKGREWRRNHPEAARAIWHRRKARKMAVGGDFDALQWKALLEYYAPIGRCPCCDKRRKLTIDHVIPIAKGGVNSIDNIQPLCKPCNSSKGDERTTDYRFDGGEYAKYLVFAREESLCGS